MSDTPTLARHDLLADSAIHRPSLHVSVVVPVRDRAEDLRDCLCALKESTCLPHEVIVVDDGSRDDSASVADELGASVIRLSPGRGPATARNRGAASASGDIVMFVDADVQVHPDALQQVSEQFRDRKCDAIFGTYDDNPAAPNTVSQFRNLMHRDTHCHARTTSSSFWAGLGAVTRSSFDALGGFAETYVRPCVEDIELGIRMAASDQTVIAVPQLQGTHRKRWTLPNIVWTDIRDRGIPWTRLIWRDANLPNDLNLSWRQRIAALCALCATIAWLVGAAVAPPATAIVMMLSAAIWLATSLAGDHATTRRVAGYCEVIAAPAVVIGLVALAWASAPLPALIVWGCSILLVWLNRSLYTLLFRRWGILFAIACLPLHFVYYGCAILSFALGTARHAGERLVRWRRPAQP